MTQNEFDAEKTDDVKTSGTAGAGRDPKEQKRERSNTEIKNDESLGNQQQQRQAPAETGADNDVDRDTSPNSIVEERVDVGTKDWR